jgi:hypothetical protein
VGVNRDAALVGLSITAVKASGHLLMTAALPHPIVDRILI